MPSISGIPAMSEEGGEKGLAGGHLGLHTQTQITKGIADELLSVDSLGKITNSILNATQLYGHIPKHNRKLGNFMKSYHYIGTPKYTHKP